MGRGSPLTAAAPPWVGHSTGSRPGRAIDWIQRYILVPSGRGAGKPLVLAPFQRDLLEILLADGAQAGAVSIPAGNAKSTLAAAVGLWALGNYDDSPQVPLVASNALQAHRTLFQPMQSMITNSPDLAEHFVIRRSNAERGIGSPWNNGILMPLPASDERLQGLNPTVAIIDEAELVDLEVLSALEDRLGKRTEAVVMVIGTPGSNDASALATVRLLADAGADYRVIEHSSTGDIFERASWEEANPALQAGILGYEAFERDTVKIRVAPVHVRPLLERRFRMYRLGQWLEGVVEDGWLPAGAYEACPVAPPPPDGAEVVLAIDGTYKRSTAIVGAAAETGAVFLVYAGEAADDDELVTVMTEACERFAVPEIVYYPMIRPSLIGALDRGGFPLVEWARARAEETASTNALWQAIASGTFVHDGSALLAEHFANVAYRDTPAGVVLRRIHKEGRWIDAAMAARMCWTHVQSWSGATPAMFS